MPPRKNPGSGPAFPVPGAKRGRFDESEASNALGRSSHGEGGGEIDEEDLEEVKVRRRARPPMEGALPSSRQRVAGGPWV